ncbi:hypothetical protein L1049_021151 [Liquidambar formosana]|uniref:Uncharacterized protein n=1 Tax=Liquidambar formosana TaxID=63359 RepID=A0AAP0S8V4_LIQFO
MTILVTTESFIRTITRLNFATIFGERRCFGATLHGGTQREDGLKVALKFMRMREMKSVASTGVVGVLPRMAYIIFTYSTKGGTECTGGVDKLADPL